MYLRRAARGKQLVGSKSITPINTPAKLNPIKSNVLDISISDKPKDDPNERFENFDSSERDLLIHNL